MISQALENKRILIFQQRNWAVHTGHFLATKLQAEGCKLVAFTLKKSTHEFIINQQEVKYELIISNDEVMNNPKAYLRGEKYDLGEICRALEIDSIWPLVSVLRHHVKSYKDKYYYSFRQNVSDEGIIDYVMATYKVVKNIFDQFNPQIILAPNFVSFPHIVFNLYAQKRGVTMIAVTDCKVTGPLIFTYSYNDDAGPFYDRIDELNGKRAETANRDKAKEYIKNFRKNFIKPDTYQFTKNRSAKQSLSKMIKNELRPYYQIFQWYTTKKLNVLESTGITPDYRPPKIILRDHYGHKRYEKFMNNYNYYPFEKLGKYVYLPLNFQPEANIDVVAPYFANQIETARQIAMSLPDDYTLAVKEHPEMLGFRSPSYLEKLARTPNVKLIDYRISSEQVLKGADMVVSPNSTTLVEAAFYNKPALQLGDLGTTLKLPNVAKYTEMTSVARKIKELLASDFHNDDYEWRLENFVAAAFDTGFYAHFEKLWEKKETEELEILWQVYKKEIEQVLAKS